MKMSGIKVQTISRLLRPYTPPPWAKVISPIPLYKVELANINTPMHQWNLPGLRSEFKVGIKRDNMTGSTLTGNKVRKLEFLMADALQNNYKHVITCGNIQSNHCRAVAVCSRQLGLVPHLILRGDQNVLYEIGKISQHQVYQDEPEYPDHPASSFENSKVDQFLPSITRLIQFAMAVVLGMLGNQIYGWFRG